MPFALPSLHRAVLHSCARLLTGLLACALIGLSVPTQAAGIGDIRPPGTAGTGGCDPARQSCSPGGSSQPMPCTASPAGQTCGGGAEPASLGNRSGTNVGAGNPINLLTANKYQREVDLPALPGVLGLELVRHYNSTYAQGKFPTGILGRGWKLSYETRLYETAHSIQIREADGSTRIFPRDPKQPSLCASQDASLGVVHINPAQAGSRYAWVWPNGRRLSFDADGKLVSIQAPTGESVSLQYNPQGHLVQVRDPQGRELRLHYRDPTQRGGGRRFRGVVAIDTPVGRYRYAYHGDLTPPPRLSAWVSAKPGRC